MIIAILIKAPVVVTRVMKVKLELLLSNSDSYGSNGTPFTAGPRIRRSPVASIAPRPPPKLIVPPRVTLPLRSLVSVGEM